MASVAPPSALARADLLLRLGFSEPAEVDDVVATLSALCGATVTLALQGAPGAVPSAEAALAQGRPPGARWTALGPGQWGCWLLDPRGAAWGLLVVPGPGGEGLDRAARLLEAMVARAQARRERRGGARGPAASAFVPGLVHELRNASFGFAAILDAFQTRYPDREEASRYGGALRTALERLTGFIDELGAYGDPHAAPREALPLERLLREAAALCQPQAEALGLDCRVVWEGEGAQVLAEAVNLREAFASLARWALGQGGGGPVVLRAGRGVDGTTAVGRVEGPGLRAGDLDLGRVFEPFYFRASGLGRLALPVARRILEAHGGALTAAAGPGGDVRLSFTLPTL